jgi:hypothetical protein
MKTETRDTDREGRILPPSIVPAMVYISGPMRGYTDDNWPAFDEAAEYLRARGLLPVSPADMERAIGRRPGCLDGASNEEIRETVRRDIAAVESLRTEYGDFVLALPGWKHSVGATAEIAVARFLLIPVFEFHPESLKLTELDWKKEFNL